MGISFDVQATKPDYSHLFSSVGSAAGNAASSNWLGDYAAIKNGSYGKLMKAYYADSKGESAWQSTGTTATSKSSKSNVLDRILEEKRHPKVSKEAQKANAELTSGLSSLKTSVSVLQNDKTYTDTANGQSAADKVVSAIKSYVSEYNNVVNAAKNSTLANKTAYVANVMSTSATNADKLSEIGITVNSNGTLDLDEAKLKEAGVSKVQEMSSSKNVMSYGSTVASRLQFAGAANGSNATDNNGTDSTAASSASSLKADGKALASSALYEKVKDKDGNETDQYDIEKIFATAKSFVNNYNRMFDAAESSSNSGVLANLSHIREKTAQNADALKQFGINVDEKGKLKIDEDTFKKADMSQVQKFFSDYGSSIATSASLVDYYMTTQANAASGYTSTGAYNVQGSSRYADTV